MRWLDVLSVTLAGTLGAAAPGPALASTRPKPAPCPGGRFPVSGAALVPGGSVPDAVIIEDLQVSIASGCAAVKARRHVTRKTTTLTAHWRRCTGLRGPAILVAALDEATCNTATVRFTARRAKVRRRFPSSLELPPDAFGKLDGALPPGARLVSADEYHALSQRPDFRSIGRQQVAADKAAEDARDADNEQTAAAFLRLHPGLAPQYLGGVDPADPMLASADDGNYALTIMDGTGGTHQVTTHGRRWLAAGVADNIRNFPTRTNQLKLYREYYAGLAAIDPALAAQHPSPDQVDQFALTDLRGLNDQFAATFDTFAPLVAPPGGLPPPGYPSQCSSEAGAGDGTDRTGGTCAHTANGLYKTFAWPLKFFATCVRNQGARGTCWDFATTGSVELWVAKKYKRWVNLSEAHMNFMTKHIWYPSVYGDGAYPGDALAKILDTGYLYPFEAQWDYNPSYSRTASDKAATYTGSCLGYGGDEKDFCSDTNHQGELICAKFLGALFCAAIGPSLGSDSTFTPTNYSEIWNPESPSYSLGVILWAVGIFQKPVIYSFAVPPSFYPENPDGYAVYHGPHCTVTTGSDGKPVCHTAPGCECDEGGHAVLVTGFIDNSQLPMGAPPGSGGGYLIIKNSWGACWGDGGYVYLPYAWVEAYGASAIVVGDIN